MYFYDILCLISAFQATQAAEVTNLTYVDGTKNGSRGVITSPNYPGNYPNNVNYTWILRTGHPNAAVDLTIVDINIKSFIPSDCDDYLQINETYPNWRQAMKRCGQFSSVNQTVWGQRIAISFLSDININATGFHLTWKVHLPELLTTLMTKTPPITTTTRKLTTTLSTTPITTTTLATTLKTTLITTRTTPATTPSTLKTTVMATTSQPSSEPKNSPHVSTTFSNPTRKEQTSPVLTATTTPFETTTAFTANATKFLTTVTIKTEKNATSSDVNKTMLDTLEIMYLILGISVAELMLIAFGICLFKRRKNNSSIKANSRDIQVDKIRPISRKSVMSVANAYESIPLDHFSQDAILEEDEGEGMYVDLPEHVYDRQFVHRPHRNEKVNFYQVISELKNKKA